MSSALRPTNFSRVTMLMQSNLLLDSIRNNSVDLLKVQNQLSSGLKLSRPSDNPADATTIMHLDNLLERQQQYKKNLDYASDFLNTTDQSLTESVNLVVQAHGLALQSIGTSTDDDGRRANAQMIDQIIAQMVTLANTTCRGSYVFGGQNSTSAPFEKYSGGVLYHGTRDNLMTSVAADSDIIFNANGNDTFGATSSQVKGIADLNPDITRNTLLSNLNGALGEGVRLSTIIINDGTNVNNVDLSNCVTVGDVIDKINSSTVGTTTASIGADGTSLQIVSTLPGASVTVSEVGTGHVAHDLGIFNNTGGSGIVSGQDVDARLTSDTPISVLKGGAGIDTISGLRITNSMVDDIGPIDISSAKTLGDILTTINNAGLGVKAEINKDGTGINIFNTLSGSQMSIGENGGSTATDLGIRSMVVSTKLASLNGGEGVATTNKGEAGVIKITDRQGNSYNVDLSTASTVQDVIDLINTATGGNVTAGLNAVGNGITLTNNVGGTGKLSVTTASDNGYFVAKQLGLDKSVDADTLVGDDVNPVVPDGLFSHLIALRDALLNNDDAAISAADKALVQDRENLSRVHGTVGARAKAIDDRKDRMDDSILATKSLRSDIADIDFSEAITRYQNLYTALQGNLKTGGELSKISLLDFLK